jgi:hypothetical protein
LVVVSLEDIAGSNDCAGTSDIYIAITVDAVGVALNCVGRANEGVQVADEVVANSIDNVIIGDWGSAYSSRGDDWSNWDNWSCCSCADEISVDIAGQEGTEEEGLKFDHGRF